MVTVHRFDGFRFAIYSNDHEPAHIHVIGAGSEAKIQLAGKQGLTLIWQFGIRPAEMRKIMVEVGRKQKDLLSKWDEIHG
jgi:hypothetical protein